jgi:hypothetical protein
LCLERTGCRGLFVDGVTVRLKTLMDRSGFSIERRAGVHGIRLSPRLPLPDPGLGAERGEGLEEGIQLLLQKLAPTERAAYILREGFDYTYRDIANALRLAEANARQVVTRARQHLADGRKMSANSTEQRRLSEALIAAAQNGDVASLEETLCSGCWAVSTRQRVPIARTNPVDGSGVRCQRAAA